MTPRFWNKAGTIIEKYEKILVRIGLVSLAIVALSLGYILIASSRPSPIILLPVLLLFFFGGLGLVKLQFKTKIDKENKDIDTFMEQASKGENFMLWYGSIFITIWLVGVAVIGIQIVAKYFK